MRVTYRDDTNIDVPVSGLDRVGGCVGLGVKRLGFRSKIGFAEFDLYGAVTFQSRPRLPAGIFENKFPVCFIADVVCDTAGAVTALIGFAAVRIEDAVEHVALFRARRLEPQQLIEADARSPVAEIADRGTGQLYPRLGLDNDKVIAESMHFRKRDTHQGLPVGGFEVVRLYLRHGL
jgi:hypothetical protein